MKTLVIFLVFISAPSVAVAQSSAEPTGVVDSVVVTRKSDLCGQRPCPTSRVSLRRSEFSGGELDTLASKARSDHLYRLPPSVLGKTSWCYVAMSDAVMATITIYHRQGHWTTRGYRHCIGPKGILDGAPRDTPVEKRRLLQLEASIDSLAAKTRNRLPATIPQNR
jgi:hypothetical protein